MTASDRLTQLRSLGRELTEDEQSELEMLEDADPQEIRDVGQRMAEEFCILTQGAGMQNVIDDVQPLRNGFSYLYDGLVCCVVLLRRGLFWDMADASSGEEPDPPERYAAYPTLRALVDRMRECDEEHGLTSADWSAVTPYWSKV